MAALSTLVCLGAMAGAAEVAPPRWKVGAPVLEPGPPGSFDEVAVKDPSIVRFDGRWHVFYTACAKRGYSLAYVSAPDFAGLNTARRVRIVQARGVSEPYAAAPQVFYFEPSEQWYLLYQTRDMLYQPAFSNTSNVADPASWTPAASLAEKKDNHKWIDFWVICDETSAYLFYTRAHRDVYVMSCPLNAFPQGLGNPRKAFGPVHEAVHIYKAQGRDEYHMIYELSAEGDERSFGLAVAPSLEGPWTNVTPRYAAGNQLVYPPGVPRWTEEVSHGEMVRTGYDQRLEYEPEESRFLVQGILREAHKGPYPSLVWRLGIIQKQ